MNEKTDQPVIRQEPDVLFMTSNLLVIMVSIFCLVWNLWPGSLEKFQFFILLTAIFWMPILLCVLGYMLFRILRERKKNRPRAKSMLFCFGLNFLILFFLFIVLSLDIPLRVAFIFSKYGFERNLEEQQGNIGTSLWDDAVIPSKISIWYVDRCLKDERGGIYFRIGRGNDWIDIMSYGFAFEPNAQGTPFGNADYTYTKIIDKWYYFSVSDDR